MIIFFSIFFLRRYVSVPDFPTLCWLYLTPSNSMNGRFRILQMMMGTQVASAAAGSNSCCVERW